MDSQESSPTPQFKSIHSSLLSFLYSPPIYSRWSSREAAMPTALEGVHMEWRSTVGSLLVTTMPWVLWMTNFPGSSSLESILAEWCVCPQEGSQFRMPGSSVHWILQARILEWAVISFSRRSSRPRDSTWVSRTAGRLCGPHPSALLPLLCSLYLYSWLWLETVYFPKVHFDLNGPEVRIFNSYKVYMTLDNLDQTTNNF